MWTLNLRIGIAEIVAVASLAIVAAVLVVAAVSWPVAVVPAVTYGLAMSVGYGLYRRYANEARHLRAHLVRPEAAVTFRVVDTHGACPLGRRVGDLITVGDGTFMGPELCAEAAGVLRVAARDGHVKQWCCPVYDHMLVFEREPVAA